MAWPIQPIRLFGDPVLRTPASEVVDFDKELRGLVEDLQETMLDAPGVGLAAPQIGVSLRVFTYYVDDVLGHLVNPTLDLSGDPEQGEEGCLSFPGIYFDTPRAPRVVAKGLNMYGEPVVLEGSELLARCIQHETDHLDGVLFIDRMDRAQRKQAMKAIREAEWAGGPPRTSRSARTRPSARRCSRCASSSPAHRPWRCPSLEALLASRHQVVAVITRPDAPSGRGRQVMPSPVRDRAEALGIEVLTPWRLGEADFQDRLRALGPECCPIVAYGALVPPPVLRIPRARLGEPALLGAAGLARCRAGAARADRRRRGRGRHHVRRSRRAWTPGRSTA